MIAIVVSLKREIGPYIDRHQFKPIYKSGGVEFLGSNSQPSLVVATSGIGKLCAIRATKIAIGKFSPDLIISAGFAGGVKPGYKTGDIVYCNQMLSSESLDFTKFNSFKYKMSNPITNETGHGCLTVDKVIHDKFIKRTIGNNFPVTVIDMEGFWVAEIADSDQIPIQIVRAIYDSVDDSLPKNVAAIVQLSNSGWYRFLREVAKRPLIIPHLFKLYEKSGIASEALSETLEKLVNDSAKKLFNKTSLNHANP